MKTEQSKFLVLEGIRGITSVWVVFCHVTGFLLLLTFILYYNNIYPNDIKDETILAVMSSYWPKTAIAWGYQVDIFFLISSFLFSLQLLQKRQAKLRTNSFISHTGREIGSFLVKRLLRLWPMTICTILWSIWMGDYNTNNPWVMLALLLFPIHPLLPISFIVCWSIPVDIINSIIVLTVVKYGLHNTGFLTYLDREMTSGNTANGWYWLNLVGLLMIGCTIIPRMIVFCTTEMSYHGLLTTRDLRAHFINIFIDPKQFKYYTDVLFPGFLPDTLSNFQYPGENPNYFNIIVYEYIAFYHRMTPFFTGLFLALRYYFMNNSKAKEYQESELASKSNVIQLLVFVMALYCVLQPIFIGLSHMERPTDIAHFTCTKSALLSDLEYLTTNQSMNTCNISNCTMTITDYSSFSTKWFPVHNFLWRNSQLYSIINRPLFTLGCAFFLSRLLLPRDHPDHLTRLHSFFERSVFQVFGRYSYGIYFFHNRIILQLMMKSVPLFSLYRFLKGAIGGEVSVMNEKVVLIIMGLIYLLLTTFFSTILSWFCTEWIEQPFFRYYLQPWIKSWER